MIPPTSLGALAGIHELIDQLVEDLPQRDCNRRFHPRLPSMGWLLGRAIYLETYWLRERLLGDDDLTRRVRHLFAGTELPTAEQEAQLPPRDHLLNWALEIQDHHLTLLANPDTLPMDHPWLHNGWLVDYLVQRHGLTYERMLSVRLARAVTLGGEHQVAHPLHAALPAADCAEISQGHYRIGARDGVVLDNEQPMQVVELRNFRIQRQPLHNTHWLAFMEAGGYRDPRWWDDPHCAERKRGHPWTWRQDAQGHWYALGLNGPMPLFDDQPVSGLSWHEARAFSRWIAATAEEFRGAVLPHEFHWETAARLGLLEEHGKVWEWCSAPMQPYEDYQPPADPEMATPFHPDWRALRGGCLHTQPRLRRPSLRHQAPPAAGWIFSGLRLMLPPALEEEALYREQWQQLFH